MAQAPDNSVIRVINASGKTVGTGFLVTDCLAVTCAHVIEMADLTPGDQVEVGFYCGAPNQLATILHDGYSPRLEADVAFIKLNEKPIGSEPVILCSSEPSISHPSRCLGYPGGSENASRSNDTINGLLTDRTPPVLQFQSNMIERGFSGAPVYDEVLQGVVGMVDWGHDKTHTVVVHAVTADTIALCCPASLTLLTPPEKAGRKQLFHPIEWAAMAATILQAFPAFGHLIEVARGFRGTYAFVSFGLFILSLFGVLGWIGFARKKSVTKYRVREKGQWRTNEDIKYDVRYPILFRYARVGLGISLAAVLVLGGMIYDQARTLESKTIILVTSLEGPELQDYRVNEILIDKLREEVRGYDEIIVQALPQSINETQGSAAARALGRDYQADIVLWGWYGKTGEQARLTIHIENLNASRRVLQEDKTKLKMKTAVAELENYVLQDNVSAQMSALALTITATSFYDLGDYEQAVSRFEQAAELFRQSSDDLGNRAPVYFYLGTAYFYLGQLEHAIQDYDQVLQIDPQDAAANNNRGVVYSSLGQPERAIQDYNQALKIDPQDAKAYYNRGLAYDDLGQYERAIEDYDQALKIDPQDAKAYYNRGHAYDDLGQYEHAIQDYDQVLQIDPQDAEAYNNRGNAYSSLGQPERAIEDYDQALKIDPQDAMAYYNRGLAYDDLEQLERAIEDYDQALKIDPQDAAAYNNRGNIYKKLGQYERAVQDFDQALQVDPKYEKAYFNRGNVFSSLGQYERAIQDYDQALQIDPLNAAVYYNRGLAYRALGQYERTIQDFDQALQIDPQNAIAFTSRGNVYYFLMQYERAIQDFDQALQIDPQNAIAYVSRGIAYYSLGNYEKAIQDYDQALQFNPQNADAYINRGYAYADLGQYERAIQDYDRALQIDPQDALAYYVRALSFLSLGQEEKAVADLRNCQEISQDAVLRQMAEQKLKELTQP